ncbi:YcxB family protein [Agrobacterium sp. DKPNP3]|uniref:YcxB family protein n=1 Tax=Agrobacterium sp. DKPNP3 TaxID=3457323 RepID=UPI004043EF37
MTRVLTKRSLARNSLAFVLWLFSLWYLIGLLTDIVNPKLMATFLYASSFYFWIFLAIIAVSILLSFFNHWLAAGISFFYFRQIASAGATLTLTMSEGGVESQSEVAKVKFPWRAVKRIIHEGNYLIMAISRREAIIFPRRGFNTDSEFEAAYQFAADRLSAYG